MSIDAILKYDLNQLRQNAEKLVSIGRNTNVRFLLAVKVHAHPVLIDLFGGILSGFDISNKNEIELLPKNKNDFICSLCGPAFNIYDVNRLLAYEGKSRVILQSLRQFDILERTNYLLDYGIRLKTNDESRFGIEPNNLEL
ncbi:MAG: hypothetical protein HY072_06095, partial [Deltaproteobacteria bacterium]|nr:hypothetical protein [Deltaproteobacteria bacterium]